MIYKSSDNFQSNLAKTMTSFLTLFYVLPAGWSLREGHFLVRKLNTKIHLCIERFKHFEYRLEPCICQAVFDIFKCTMYWISRESEISAIFLFSSLNPSPSILKV